MNIYQILTKEGCRSFAFEVENVYIAPTTVAYLLAEVDGVSDVKPRKMFLNSSDLYVEFQYRGQPYIVWEPYGDSSRYWIGPKDEMNDVGDITAIEEVFKSYRPSFFRMLLGDILTFRFIIYFFQKKCKE